MKLPVRINARERVLERTAAGVKIDGEAVVFDAVDVEPGVYSILIEGRSFEAVVEYGPDGRRVVEVDGRRFDIAFRDPRRYRSEDHVGGVQGRQTLTASMPGRIVKVLVAAGDTVETGQGLLVVEAMKMQNEVKSPKAGAVAEVCVAEGASVASGAALVVID